MKSLKETSLVKLSSFLIEMIISSRPNPRTVKKINSGNLLVEVDNKKHADNLIKMKTFHNLKGKSYLYKKLNTLKSFLKQRFLVTPEEIQTALRKQGITDYKRGDDEIHILIFNKSIIPEEVKIGYCHIKVNNTSPHP